MTQHLALHLYDITLDTPSGETAPLNMRQFSPPKRAEILAAHIGVAPETLEFIAGEHGKPMLKNHPQVKFNISHSGNIWAIAVSEGHDIGLDIERHKPRKNMDGIVSTYFHPQENAIYEGLTAAEKHRFFFKLWTQKEAYAKYRGEGLHYDFSSESFLAKPPKDVGIFSNDYSISSQDMPISISIVSDMPINKENHQIKGNVTAQPMPSSER